MKDLISIIISSQLRNIVAIKTFVALLGSGKAHRVTVGQQIKVLILWKMMRSQTIIYHLYLIY